MLVAPDVCLDPAAVEAAREANTREATGFERMIERQIHERTRGRIRDLQVTVSDNRVTVRGVSPTYYIKQLAIHALLENIEPTMTPVVDIIVE